MELILTDFATQSFGMVVIASVTASAIGHAMLGNHPFLTLPASSVQEPVEYVYYAIPGLLAGAVRVGFTRVLYPVEDGCDATWRGPEGLRPAVGGLFLGVVLLVLPRCTASDTPSWARRSVGGYVLGFLVVLLLGKILATPLTIGIGGSGGVFAPSLFVGAMPGAAFADVARATLTDAGPVGTYARIVTRPSSPARHALPAVVILFELTAE